MNNKINILICFDRNYYNQAITMVKSMLLNNSRLFFVIHCFVRNIQNTKIEQFINKISKFKNANVQIYNISYQFKKYHNSLTHVSVSTMDRLLVTDILEKKIDRVLYLDIDLLVLSKIDELLTIDTGPVGIAARDSIEKNVVKDWLTYHPDTQKTAAKFYNHSEGFNAGVLLISLNTMRSNKFKEKTIAYYKKAGFNDQIILNLYANRQYVKLCKKYNTYATKEPCDDPAILHFVGEKKPWDSNHEFSKLWNFYSTI